MPVLAAAVVLLGMAAVARLVIGLTFDGYVLPSLSMSPTLTPGDRVLARSVSGDDVARGDVVIHRGAAGSDRELVGRVVAVAGDEVGADAGTLTINGVRAEEPYLAPGTRTEVLKPVKVPPDHVFVMGDNRSNSSDSRVFGPVPNTQVRKRVVVQWWPLGEIGRL